jgi:AbrB family looped-hinge helix DNA binding protein
LHGHARADNDDGAIFGDFFLEIFPGGHRRASSGNYKREFDFDFKVKFRVILKSMKISGRGPVTIPKEIRDRFDLGPETEVEFHVVHGAIFLKKARRR